MGAKLDRREEGGRSEGGRGRVVRGEKKKGEGDQETTGKGKV